ncbi:hypothetical protein ACPPVV_17665 [Rhodanobacter sp. Col0626]|uniref:hypothetical protein n=1 Tax=Rhodanobacter sp. Col0626 TaxID=3415679 RepID=UPI003CF10300
MKSFLAALVIFASFGASAADAFHYDHRLALDLAQAYLSSSHRQHPSFDAYTDSANSAISSAIAAHKRHLVFVTFAKAGSQAGSYVELELCAETNLLTVVDTGTVDNIRAYRADTMRVNSKIFVASPAVCSAEVP